jgi:hypothetical protein
MKNEFDRLSKVQPLIKSLYETSKETLGFKPDAKIVILTNEENSNNPLGKTAYYDPASHKIGLYTQGRHVKDIMRSLSHELVHHSQNCRGDFNEGIATVEGYAQEDGHLREMEREAYETGNLIFRDWEDNYKRNDNTKLFTDTSIMGEKLMEDKEAKLREVIRGLVKEMLVNVKENIDDPDAAAQEDAARGDEVSSQAAVAAALGGVKTSNEDGEEDEPFQGVSEGEHKTPGGGDYADEEEEYEGVKKEKEEMDESTFFPQTHDIREKARHRTHEALMKRWGYSKKND